MIWLPTSSAYSAIVDRRLDSPGFGRLVAGSVWLFAEAARGWMVGRIGAGGVGRGRGRNCPGFRG